MSNAVLYIRIRPDIRFISFYAGSIALLLIASYLRASFSVGEIVAFVAVIPLFGYCSGVLDFSVVHLRDRLPRRQKITEMVCIFSAHLLIALILTLSICIGYMFYPTIWNVNSVLYFTIALGGIVLSLISAMYLCQIAETKRHTIFEVFEIPSNETTIT